MTQTEFRLQAALPTSSIDDEDKVLPVTSYACQWKPPRKRKESTMKMAEAVFQKHQYDKRKWVIEPVEHFDPRPGIGFLHSSTRFMDRDCVFPFSLTLKVAAGLVSVLYHPPQSNHLWQLWRLQWSPSRRVYACLTMLSVRLSVKQRISGCPLCSTIQFNSFYLWGSILSPSWHPAW